MYVTRATRSTFLTLLFFRWCARDYIYVYPTACMAVRTKCIKSFI